jgi:hypothetical protein
MVLKSYLPDITAEEINESVNINHKTRFVNHKNYAERALKPEEIQTAIKNIAGLDSYIFDSSIYSHFDFITIVYRAIESRLPIIFIFNLANSTASHAVAIIGHTFNKHTWIAYSLKEYLSHKENEPVYRSSSLWCDNFIIQDENLGPYYFISTQIIPAKKKVSRIKNFCQTLKNQYIKDSSAIEDIWKYGSPKAIIVYPETISFFKSSARSIEPYAALRLRHFIQEIKKSKSLPNTKIFNTYFQKYYESNDLIFRTFLLHEDKYLQNLKEFEFIEEFWNNIKDKLPKIFWIVEISVPELFWVNKAKVGEMIIDPLCFEKNDHDHHNNIKLIRLPNIIYIGKNELYSYDQNRAYNSLIVLREASFRY